MITVDHYQDEAREVIQCLVDGVEAGNSPTGDWADGLYRSFSSILQELEQLGETELARELVWERRQALHLVESRLQVIDDGLYSD